MNRVGVIKGVYTSDANMNTADVGDLLLLGTNGRNIGVHGGDVLNKPSVIELFVKLKNGAAKSLGQLNPRNYKISSSIYADSENTTIVLGYNSLTTSGVLTCLDPSLSLNLNKFGTLSIKLLDNAGTGYIPKWGKTFDADVYIQQGDTLATIYARLDAAATKLVSKINGLGYSLTYTKDITSSNKFLKFVSNSMSFNVTLDGIFDGTSYKIYADTPITMNGLIGLNVVAKEKEAAVLDGYNPIQTDKFKTFDLSSYLIGEIDKEYDCVLIETVSDSKLESPTFTSGWDTVIEIYCERTSLDDANTIGAVAERLTTILDSYRKSFVELTPTEIVEIISASGNEAP